MRPAGPAHAARTRFARARGGGRLARNAGSEHGKFLRELFGPAFGARCAFPFARTHQEFAVLTALFAMKLVNRHRSNLASENSRAIRAARENWTTQSSV